MGGSCLHFSPYSSSAPCLSFRSFCRQSCNYFDDISNLSLIREYSWLTTHNSLPKAHVGENEKVRFDTSNIQNVFSMAARKSGVDGAEEWSTCTVFRIGAQTQKILKITWILIVQVNNSPEAWVRHSFFNINPNQSPKTNRKPTSPVRVSRHRGHALPHRIAQNNFVMTA